MYLVLLEDRPHRVVAPDHALVAWVLQVVCADVFPDFFDGLRTGELGIINARSCVRVKEREKGREGDVPLSQQAKLTTSSRAQVLSTRLLVTWSYMREELG